MTLAQLPQIGCEYDDDENDDNIDIARLVEPGRSMGDDRKCDRKSDQEY